MSALLALQLCVCDSDSDYERPYDDIKDCGVSKPIAADVARSETHYVSLSNSGLGRESNSFASHYQQGPESRVQAMKLATREAAEAVSKRSAPSSPSPAFMMNMSNFSRPVAPSPNCTITSIQNSFSNPTSFPVQRCTSGSSDLSLARVARTALNCAPGVTPALGSSSRAAPRVGRRVSSGNSFCTQSPSHNEVRQVLTNPLFAPGLKSASFGGQPTSPRGTTLYRQSSNPSVGIGSPRGSSVVVDVPSLQRLQSASFSSNPGEIAVLTSPRLCSPTRQVSFPSATSSTTLGEVASRQPSVVGQSSSFSSNPQYAAPGSPLGVPRPRSPTGGPPSLFWRADSRTADTMPQSPRQVSPSPPSLFWRTDSRAADNTMSPRQMSPSPPRATPEANLGQGFSPFWQPPIDARNQSFASVTSSQRNDSLSTPRTNMQPPPGLLGDLLRAVPQPAKPKTVFWQPPPEAAAVCST